MRVVWPEDSRPVAEWAKRHFNFEISGPCIAMVVLGSNGLRGAAIWHDYRERGNIEISFVGPNALQRPVLQEIMRYAFETCGCTRLSARTRRSNTRMASILPRLGFEPEGVLKHYYGPGDDLLLFVMWPEVAYRQKWMSHERFSRPSQAA